MDNNKQNGFSYTYSAKEQAELKRIREKYTVREENKLERLRRLDRRATNKAASASIILGVIGALILGSGMSLTMSEFGLLLKLDTVTSLIIGIAAGIFGIALICLAYPLYSRLLRHERKKIAPEVIRLTDELLK